MKTTKLKNAVIGRKTKFYEDVKNYTMQQYIDRAAKKYKYKRVGYIVTRLYFSNDRKDRIVGQQKIKSVTYKGYYK